MSRKVTFLLVGLLVITIVGLILWGVVDGRSKKSASAPVDDNTLNNQMIYYYGEECPHCQRIQAFLEESKIADMIPYIKKEVWHDAQNNAEFLQRAQSVCGIDQSKLGVPFVIVDGKCYSGEVEVTKIFKTKAGIQ